MSNLKVFAISNIGNVRDNHEDNLFIPKNQYIKADKQKEIKSNDITIEYDYEGNEGVFAICDGMGGHNAGEVASRLAVEEIEKKYNELLDLDKEKLLQFIKDLNFYICECGEKDIDKDNMGTTFSSLIFKDDKVALLHVGDSRIYKCDKEGLKQISKDHTEGCRLLEAGIVKEEDLPKISNRKSLYKYLGRKVELIAYYEELKIEENDRYIISSDGLSDTLSFDEIKDVVEKKDLFPSEVCKNLLDKCLKKKDLCSDNVTIICIDINK